MAGARTLGVVVGELVYRKEPCSIVLFKVNKSPKVNLHSVVLLFCLTVCLRMERSREPPFNAKKVAKQ